MADPIKLRSPEELLAWDRFAAAVLAGWWACGLDDLPDPPDDEEWGQADFAAEAADLMIEARRQRCSEATSAAGRTEP